MSIIYYRPLHHGIEPVVFVVIRSHSHGRVALDTFPSSPHQLGYHKFEYPNLFDIFQSGMTSSPQGTSVVRLLE